MNERKRIHVKIYGRVQGVCFREYTRREAVRLDVSGWVKNCPDGTVEVDCQGKVADVDAMSQWLEGGPAYAKVDRVVTLTQEKIDYCTMKGFFIDF